MNQPCLGKLHAEQWVLLHTVVPFQDCNKISAINAASPEIEGYNLRGVDLFGVFKARANFAPRLCLTRDVTLQTGLPLEMGHHVFSSALRYVGLSLWSQQQNISVTLNGGGVCFYPCTRFSSDLLCSASTRELSGESNRKLPRLIRKHLSAKWTFNCVLFLNSAVLFLNHSSFLSVVMCQAAVENGFLSSRDLAFFFITVVNTVITVDRENNKNSPWKWTLIHKW